jgi:ElaB/YqjD/DUF883 family membrane-anchored ribosome-binding protein
MAERTYLAARAEEAAIERSSEEIRHDIAERREHITEAVDKLSDRVHETLDWRSYVVEHPVTAIGLAAGVGFLISGIFKSRPTPRDRILDAVAESVEDITGRIRSSLDMLPVKALGSKRTIKAAITALATKAAADYAKRQLSSMLSGNRDSSTEAVEEESYQTVNTRS